MRIGMMMCAALAVTVPASAQEMALGVELLPGHPVYHERGHEAGVAMALSITPGKGHASDLVRLCEELRVAAGLGQERRRASSRNDFRGPLQADGGRGLLLAQEWLAREQRARSRQRGRERALDGIVARAGNSAPCSRRDECRARDLVQPRRAVLVHRLVRCAAHRRRGAGRRHRAGPSPVPCGSPQRRRARRTAAAAAGATSARARVSLPRLHSPCRTSVGGRGSREGPPWRAPASDHDMLLEACSCFPRRPTATTQILVAPVKLPSATRPRCTRASEPAIPRSHRGLCSRR